MTLLRLTSRNFVLLIVIVSVFMITTTAGAACLALSRTVTVASYESAQEVIIELTLQNGCTETIASLGISESLPRGWQFISGEAVSGTAPVQWLAPGSTDRLEIFWITVPEFPVVLRYTAKAPEDATATAVFSGYAMFSFTTGNQKNSDVMETALMPTVVTEGEGEGEGEAQVEGEPVTEGEKEGEVIIEGEEQTEAESAGEGEGEGEGEEGAPVGCCRRQPTTKAAGGSIPAGDGVLLAGGIFILIVPRRYRKRTSP